MVSHSYVVAGEELIISYDGKTLSCAGYDLEDEVLGYKLTGLLSPAAVFLLVLAESLKESPSAREIMLKYRWGGVDEKVNLALWIIDRLDFKASPQDIRLTSKWCWRYLASSNTNYGVLSLMVSKAGKYLSMDVYRKLAQHPQMEVRTHVAHSPWIDQDIQMRLSQDKEFKVRHGIALSRKTLPAILSSMAENEEDENVISNIAMNKNLSPVDAHKLLLTYDPAGHPYQAAYYVIKYRRLSPESHDYILSSPHSDLHRILAFSSTTPSSILHQLAHLPLADEQTRTNICSNPHTKLKTLEYLKNDTFLKVRDHAQQEILKRCNYEIARSLIRKDKEQLESSMEP